MTNLEIVQENGLKLKDIKNKSLFLCIAAVKQNPEAIKYVKKQNETLNLLAVKSNGLVIADIKNPSLQVCKVAIEQNLKAFGNIKNHTPELCLWVLKYNPSSFTMMRKGFKKKNINETIQFLSLKDNKKYILDAVKKIKKDKRVKHESSC